MILKDKKQVEKYIKGIALMYEAQYESIMHTRDINVDFKSYAWNHLKEDESYYFGFREHGVQGGTACEIKREIEMWGDKILQVYAVTKKCDLYMVNEQL